MNAIHSVIHSFHRDSHNVKEGNDYVRDWQVARGLTLGLAENKVKKTKVARERDGVSL